MGALTLGLSACERSRNNDEITLTITQWVSSHHFYPDEEPLPITTSQYMTRGDEVTIAAQSSEATITIQRITDDYIVILVVSNGISDDPRFPLPGGRQTFEIPFGEGLRLETMTMSTVTGWSLVFIREQD